MNWFKEAGLGMFIHWGVYSVAGRGEWMMHQENMPLSDYDAFIPEFTADRYDPEEWALLAKRAGMTYMVLTTKHHDGFCLFDTATTERSAVKQGPRRDLVMPYVEACRKHGLKVGLYFSLPDWSIPAFSNGPDADPAGWGKFVDLTHEQLRELMTGYGKIDLLWYDNIVAQSGGRKLTAEDFKSKELNAMIRQLQPGILINDRSLLPEDFHTAEQSLIPPGDPDRIWEGCITMNRHWGYFPADTYYKSAFEIIMMMTGVAAGAGHILLNIGPDRHGSVNGIEQQRLEEIGDWMRVNGEAIYRAGHSRLSGGSYGCASATGEVNYLYLHWLTNGSITVPHCTEKFSRAELLGSEAGLTLRYADGNLHISGIPPEVRGKCPVIKLVK